MGTFNPSNESRAPVYATIFGSEAMASLFESPQNHDRFRLPSDIRDLRVDDGELVVTWR